MLSVLYQIAPPAFATGDERLQKGNAVWAGLDVGWVVPDETTDHRRGAQVTGAEVAGDADGDNELSR